MATALVWGINAPVHAELFKNITTAGSLEVQSRDLTNLDFTSAADDNRSKTGSRLGVGFMADLNDEVSGRVSIYKNDRAWGNAPQTITGGAGVLDNIIVGEANVSFKNVLWLDHTVGRQYYNDGGDVAVRFGPSGSHVLGLPVTAIDAWRVDWSNEKLMVHGLAGNTAQGTAFPPAVYLGPVPQTLTSLEGVEVACKDPANKAFHPKVRIYSGSITNNGAAGGHDTRTELIGLGGHGEPSPGLTYMFEILKNVGENPAMASVSGGRTSADGVGGIANAQYLTDVSAGKVQILGEFAYGSGGSAGNAQHVLFLPASDYRPGLIWGGTSALGGGAGAFGVNGAGLAGDGSTGLVTFNFGAKFSPASADKLWIGGQYYHFARATTLGGTTSAVAAGNKSYGSEVDITATWKASDRTSVRGGWSTFMPGDGLALGTPEDSVKMFSADLAVRF
jgi:hypothetical protein